MTIEFATTGLAGPQKFEAWRSVLADVFGPFELRAMSHERFHARVRCFRRAQLQFNDISYCWQIGERTRGNIAQLPQESYLLTRPIEGRLRVERGGREFTLRPGFLYLFNQSLPFRFISGPGYHSVSVSVPAAALRLREPRIGPVYRIAIGDETPGGRLLSDYMDHLAAGMHRWPDVQALGLSERLLDLIVLLMVQPGRAPAAAGDTAVKAAQRERAIAYIQAHLGEDDLDPQRIARACGISVRYLHQIFAAGGLAVEDFVYAQRLRKCRELLADPQQRGKSIAQLAYQVGFRHPAHFSRLFKARYGVSPREFRASSCSAVPAQEPRDARTGKT
ncbi:MAG TPA: helix-turn-helix domain-containing protein [Burkholderiales bacterium]